jgi:hypothetical protein
MVVLVRRVVVMPVVVLAVLACGAVVALAASGGENRPIAKAQAVAFAKAVNLRLGDLPGAKRQEPPSYEGAQDEREAQKSWAKTVRCARHGVAVHRPVHVGVSLLGDGPWLVSAEVRVMPSESFAALELGSFASKRGQVCFARADRVTVTSEDESPENPEPLKTTFLQLGRSLGVGGIGAQTLSSTTRTTLAGYSDAALFRVGCAVIVFSAVGKQPFPAATERRLLSLLHTRAEAHKL